MLYMTEPVSTEEALHDVRHGQWHAPREETDQ